MFKLIKNNSTIRLFLLMDLLSSFSVGSISTGANWFVLKEGGSNAILSLFLAINVISSFIFAPKIGHLVDTISRKKSMMLSFLFRSIVFFGVSISILSNYVVLPSMFLLSSVFGIGWMMYYSSSRSFLQQNVQKEELGVANSFLEITLQCGMFISGGITGYLLEKISYGIILLVDTCMLIVTMIIANNLNEGKIYTNNSAIKETDNNKEKTKLKINKKVISIAIFTMIPLFIIQVYNVTMPGYISNILHGGSSAYGTSDMLYGIGGLFSGIIVSKLVNKFENRQLLFGGFSVLFLSFTLLFFNKTLITLFILAFIIGLCNSGTKIITNTVMMENIENKFMGRMSTFVTAISQISSLIITLSVGLLNDKLGENFSFIIILFFVLGGWLLTTSINKGLKLSDSNM